MKPDLPQSRLKKKKTKTHVTLQLKPDPNVTKLYGHTAILMGQ
jgi:hypothetical protein